MERVIRGGCVLGFLLLCSWVVSVYAQTAPREITVRVAEATIHAEPDAESQVIDRAAAGSVYEVVRQAGEWYEVILPSRLGMVITGFIHEKFLGTPAQHQAQKAASAPARATPRPHSREKRGYFSLGGLYQRQKGYEYSFSYPVYQTTLALYDAVDGHNAFGFQVGGGYLVLENLAIDLGISYSRASPEGLYGLDWPVDEFNNEHADAPVDHKFSEIVISFGLSLYLPVEGQARPYIGGGMSYLHSKMELLKDFSVAYPPLTISNPKLAEESIGAVGFYIKAGGDIVIAESVAVFGEGRYTLALKKKVPQPLMSPNYKDEVVEIDLGGFSALFGAKIRF